MRAHALTEQRTLFYSLRAVNKIDQRAVTFAQRVTLQMVHQETSYFNYLSGYSWINIEALPMTGKCKPKTLFW